MSLHLLFFHILAYFCNMVTLPFTKIELIPQIRALPYFIIVCCVWVFETSAALQLMISGRKY